MIFHIVFYGKKKYYEEKQSNYLRLDHWLKGVLLFNCKSGEGNYVPIYKLDENVKMYELFVW